MGTLVVHLHLLIFVLLVSHYPLFCLILMLLYKGLQVMVKLFSAASIFYRL